MIWDKFSTSLWARAGAQPSVAYQRCPSSWSTSSWLTDSSVWAETSAFLVQKSKSPLAESGERWFWCVVCSHCPGAILTGAEFQGQGFVGFRSPPGDPHSATLLEVNCVSPMTGLATRTLCQQREALGRTHIWRHDTGFTKRKDFLDPEGGQL